jgi:flagellar biosynthesis/type III secretory pathway chaperone
MLDSVQSLIGALREELKQYGEMLALLDQQQDAVVVRTADDVLDTVATVSSQREVIQIARQQREECQRQLARRAGQPEDTALSRLIPLLPEAYRPLVQALLEENNQLLLRIQQRVRQNHILLTRSLELMQRFINTFLPTCHTATYNGSGEVSGSPISSSPLYEAVG